MKYIDVIYQNKFGISFYWKNKESNRSDLAQIVFRDTGFYLTLDEIKSFSYASTHTLEQARCKDCPAHSDCRAHLLKTPSQLVDLAVSQKELVQIQDLLDQTILKMEIQSFMQHALN